MVRSQADFDRLSTAEKIIHVQDLWDRIAATASEEVELTDAQREDLDRRVKEYQANRKGSSWEDVRARVRSRSRS